MQRIAIVLVFASLMAACIAQAQKSAVVPPGNLMLSSPSAFADAHMAALEKQFGLSEELKPPLRSVFLQEGKDLIAVLGDTSLSEAQKRVRIRRSTSLPTTKFGAC